MPSRVLYRSKYHHIVSLTSPNFTALSSIPFFLYTVYVMLFQVFQSNISTVQYSILRGFGQPVFDRRWIELHSHYSHVVTTGHQASKALFYSFPHTLITIENSLRFRCDSCSLVFVEAFHVCRCGHPSGGLRTPYLCYIHRYR